MKYSVQFLFFKNVNDFYCTTGNYESVLYYKNVETEPALNQQDQLLSISPHAKGGIELGQSTLVLSNTNKMNHFTITKNKCFCYYLLSKGNLLISRVNLLVYIDVISY